MAQFEVSERSSRVNSMTGTASTEVPIPMTASRGGFGPVLSIFYDSGSKNEPFGFGWQLNAPSITWKTDKGLPQYLDKKKCDCFIIGGSEDLKPILSYDNDQSPPTQVHGHVKNVQTSPRKQSPERDRKCRRLQNLHYAYDAIGNVTHIHDGAQDTIYSRNKKVDRSSDYVYDATYRLIEATGKEGLGQVNPNTAAPAIRSQEPLSTDHVHDDGSMARYVEGYKYGSTGDCLRLRHDTRATQRQRQRAPSERPHTTSTTQGTARGRKETAAKVGTGVVDTAIEIVPSAAASLARSGLKLLSKADGALEKTGPVPSEGGAALKRTAQSRQPTS
ncbi:RHS repeat-associated core domain protein [Metarhizium rileyi]|uniref:RHS repeat-associated core domain protein n=1 Tax=Metarhizium rileyi (strain RCEF 4871) TaxID=1649241 RepID=A0A162I2K2_METRR|nr:RHS repeat-associated core domain protein [Metarhizium rileyi RCEF 4871]